MSRDILDLIDNAIAGATSEDAMRWTPDEEKACAPPVFAVDVGPAGYGYLFVAADPDSPWVPLGTVADDGIVADVSRIFGVPASLVRGRTR